MEIGRRIAEQRNARGLTQKQLGSLVGEPQNAISQWETGKREPEPENIEKLATALKNCTADYLAGRVQSPMNRLVELDPEELDFILRRRSVSGKPTEKDTAHLFASENIPTQRQPGPKRKP